MSSFLGVGPDNWTGPVQREPQLGPGWAYPQVWKGCPLAWGLVCLVCMSVAPGAANPVQVWEGQQASRQRRLAAQRKPV